MRDVLEVTTRSTASNLGHNESQITALSELAFLASPTPAVACIPHAKVCNLWCSSLAPFVRAMTA